MLNALNQMHVKGDIVVQQSSHVAQQSSQILRLHAKQSC